jgi:NAD(P)-dependent dehydrogenase (short-subunit alcohol dehydrogenase family)
VTAIIESQFGENAAAMKAAMKEQFKTMIPMGRIGKPEEIASAALFLANDKPYRFDHFQSPPL